jgi:hypothetical protein
MPGVRTATVQSSEQFCGALSRERAAQVDRVVLNRLHLDAGEKLGEHLQHRFPVLQHVGDARGRAGVVLQHEEFVLAGAHKVDADDMGIDIARRRHADHLRQEGLVLRDQIDGDAARAQDFLPVVDVVQEGVDGAHPLLDPARELRPFPRRDDARHDVEGDQAFVRLGLPIDVEGDPGTAKEGFGVGGFFAQLPEVLVREPAVVGGVRIAGGVSAAKHLIEER